jgi:hypothetical protein
MIPAPIVEVAARAGGTGARAAAGDLLHEHVAPLAAGGALPGAVGRALASWVSGVAISALRVAGGSANEVEVFVL